MEAKANELATKQNIWEMDGQTVKQHINNNTRTKKQETKLNKIKPV